MKNLSNKTILVFTGGGVAPALNPTLYGVITGARKEKAKILGGIFGWASLLDNGKIIDLDKFDIEPIRDVGGTILRSSRTNPFKIENGVNQIKNNIKKNKIDYIIAIGGNDTLGAAKKLAEEESLPIIGLPKTIDNDLSGTYFTPGFPSAAHYLSSFIKEIKIDAAYALQRIFVIEAMGMNAGWLSASASYGWADIIIPPEKEIKLDKFFTLLERRYKENGNFATVAISQEAKIEGGICGIVDDQKDLFGVIRHDLICISLRDEIKKRMNIDSKILLPGNWLETGKPIEIDRKLAIELGKKAIELVKEEKFGFMANLVRPDQKSLEIKVDSVNLNEVVGENKYRGLPDEYFDYENLTVTNQFFDYMEPMLGRYEAENEYLKLIKKII
jgi:6-phosphofructokinase 1